MQYKIQRDSNTRMNRATLRRKLANYFSDDELRTLCFDLEIDYDNLGGEGKDGKTRELVVFCERTDRLLRLSEYAREIRPNAFPLGSDSTELRNPQSASAFLFSKKTEDVSDELPKAQAMIKLLEGEVNDLKIKLQVAEQVNLHLRESFQFFQDTIEKLTSSFGSRYKYEIEKAVHEAAQSQPRPISTSVAATAALTLHGVSISMFVAMPFATEFQVIYDAIKQTCEALSIRSVRADELTRPGVILDQIFDSIRESQIMLADATSNNPNVLYEIGIAHALQKPTLIIAQERDNLPFDVASQRVLFYNYSVTGIAQFRASLSDFLQEMIKDF